MKYRYLGDSGLLVSRICLGTMTFGQDKWGCDRDTSCAIVNKFVEGGGNFIDTADMYAGGDSERILGEAVRQHARDDLVLATKCWFRAGQSPNAMGLSRKHIFEALDASLSRMKLDHVDLYQIHGPDPFTPVEETMAALDDLVRSGKVRYIGCSNLFAWQMVRANGIAERLNLSRFCSGQYLYNLLRRDAERDILPACADQGVGLICWSPLGGGMLTGKYERGDGPPPDTRVGVRAEVDVPRYWREASFDVIDELKNVAEAHAKSLPQVALAWLLHDRRVTAVIVGARRTDQLDDTLLSGEWDLPDADHERLATVVPFDHGYPMEWMKIAVPNTFGRQEFGPENRIFDV